MLADHWPLTADEPHYAKQLFRGNCHRMGMMPCDYDVEPWTSRYLAKLDILGHLRDHGLRPGTDDWSIEVTHEYDPGEIDGDDD